MAGAQLSLILQKAARKWTWSARDRAARATSQGGRIPRIIDSRYDWTGYPSFEAHLELDVVR
jgi:hypothetical protein